jgi:antitoxin component of MazEF toxin-antitoxin module
MTKLTLIAIGGSTGVIIPEDMLARLNLGLGAVLHAVESADGGYHLTAYDADFAEKMARVEDIAQRYCNTLHVLAR